MDETARKGGGTHEKGIPDYEYEVAGRADLNELYDGRTEETDRLCL